MESKDLQEMLGVNWEDFNTLDLGQRMVTIISRGRALQKSDAYIMRDIMNDLAINGYGKIVNCPLFGDNCADINKCEEKYNCGYDELPCDEDGVMFEPIKVKENENGK
ncbi:MAG: hypothetical protein WC389_17325 [Lutibacter sp.]|jgi:hypothetical protein